MYNLFIHQVLSEPLPELPATLDRFTGIANTSSTPIGREGGEWAGTYIVARKGYVYTENSQMASIGAIFNSTYVSHKAAKSLAMLISQLCGELHPAVCFSGDMEPFEGYSKMHRHLTGLRNKPQQKHPGQLTALIPG